MECVRLGSQSTGDCWKAHFTESLGHNSLVCTVPSTFVDSAALHYSALHYTALLSTATFNTLLSVTIFITVCTVP